jgi:YEATS domain-containing protein 4
MTTATGTAIDKPPFAVTETGWGEFPLNIRVQFAPETGEKSVNFVHQLRLHHWGPVVHLPAHPPTATLEGTPSVMDDGSVAQTSNATPQPREVISTATDGIESQKMDGKDDGDVKMASVNGGADGGGPADLENNGVKQEDESVIQDVGVPMEGISSTNDTNNSTTQLQANPLSVNAWQYDELVFSDPTATFYDLLISHPETPLPEKSLRQPSDAEWGMDKGSFGVPLEFTQEMARAEGEKLERARQLIIDEMDQWR